MTEAEKLIKAITLRRSGVLFVIRKPRDSRVVQKSLSGEQKTPNVIM